MKYDDGSSTSWTGEKRRGGVWMLLSVCVLLLVQSSFSQSSAQIDSLLAEKQARFAGWEYGMFLHFNMGTFVDKEWATGHEDPLVFDPVRLDCAQWIRVAREAGMKYAVLTVKHTGGWCLWDSKYTTHDITAFKKLHNGQADIVREFVDACRKEGIKVGLYYCLPGDYSHSAGNTLAPGERDFHGLPPEAEGDFEGFVEKQVTELLSHYGPIDLMWFDQYENGYTGKDWPRLKALVTKLQPACVVLANNAGSFEYSDVISYEYPYRHGADPTHALPPAGNTRVSEVCDCIDAGNRWFWHSGEVTLKDADQVAHLINECHARRSNYLLDVPPDRDGRIGDAYIQRLMEIKKLLER